MHRILKARLSRDIKRDLKRIRTFSSRIEKKLNESSDTDEKIIDNLSFKELKDLNSVLLAADYFLSKYEDKKELKSFLKEFVDILTNSANSLNAVDDEISDLVISAQVTLNQIKGIHSDVIENYALNESTKANSLAPRQESSINLTNTRTDLNTEAYLSKTPVETWV
ncbi:MAG: hypothetical protein NPMRIOTA_330016 [Nitrosopumilales archaeon]|nr:MAG: hypothetical protein NPMRIOTA_330016 [Nitrosopumilales archaeon]